MNDNNNVIYTIDEIKNLSKPIFDKNTFVDKVYLFGSYAKNNATELSDLDFMVISNCEIGLNFCGLYPELQDALKKDVDVLTEEEAYRIMPKAIERDKVLVYERKN